MDPAIDNRARGNSDGFTLIELLVVVTILSVISLGAALAVGRMPGSRAASDAQLFATEFAALRGLAVHGRTATGLEISGDGWQIARFDTGAGQWEISDRLIRWRDTPRYARNAANGASLLFEVDAEPDIVFLPSGRATPVQILFLGGQDCLSDGFGPLVCRGDAP